MGYLFILRYATIAISMIATIMTIATIKPVLDCCWPGAGEVVAGSVVVVFRVVVADVELVLKSAITGSEGAANVTVHVATLIVNGVISCQVPFLSMNGMMSDAGVAHG